MWGSSLSPIMNFPPYMNFGWNADTTPYWTDLPQASKALRKLIRCNCTKSASDNHFHALNFASAKEVVSRTTLQVRNDSTQENDVFLAAFIMIDGRYYGF